MMWIQRQRNRIERSVAHRGGCSDVSISSEPAWYVSVHMYIHTHTLTYLCVHLYLHMCHISTVLDHCVLCVCMCIMWVLCEWVCAHVFLHIGVKVLMAQRVPGDVLASPSTLIETGSFC